MPRLCREHATPDEVRRGRARGGAQAPPGKPLHLGSRGSCLLRQGDAVDSTALLVAEARVSPSFFFRVPEKSPRTVCRCQPITLATSSTVAPSGRCNIAITASCFDGRVVSDGGSGSGKASIADHS